jgi:hypothetical protein
LVVKFDTIIKDFIIWTWCDHYNLFTWSKSGIVISYNLVRMNLDELEPYEALDVLENMLEQN